MTFRQAGSRRFWSAIFVAGVLVAGLRLGFSDVSPITLAAGFLGVVFANSLLLKLGLSTRTYRWWLRYVFALFDNALISTVVYLFGSPVLALTYVLVIVPYSFDRGPTLGYVTALASTAGFLYASWGFASAHPGDAVPWQQTLLAAMRLPHPLRAEALAVSADRRAPDHAQRLLAYFEVEGTKS
jgi:methyl-accepting chemotaxis protein